MIQAPVKLTIALLPYDHIYEIRGHDTDYEIRSGAVEIAGVSPRWIDLATPYSLNHFASNRDWDISDVPLAEYVQRRLAGDTRLTALPIFTSRRFLHDSITVRNDRIATPADLRGARIAVPQQNLTESIYVRGMLADVYGLRAKDARWIPSDDRGFAALLEAGKVDAVIAPPYRLAAAAGGTATRLFPRPGAAERAALKKTGVFPILRTLAIRTELLQEHRWLASNLYRAFEVARRRYFARLDDIRASRVPIPAVDGHMRTVREAFGGDFWPYGLTANLVTLNAFVRYASEQGVLPSTAHYTAGLFGHVEEFVDKY